MQALPAVFKKMNFKQQDRVLVLNAPESFAEVMQAMQAFTEIAQSPETDQAYPFVLAFVTQKSQVDILSPQINLEGDAMLWMAYPKKSSKKYQSDINRDNGWTALGAQGLEPVRQVAIDDDWSALRFRKVAFIKKITRSAKMALTDEAKKRTRKK